jgi:hypothetical protein
MHNILACFFVSGSGCVQRKKSLQISAEIVDLCWSERFKVSGVDHQENVLLNTHLTILRILLKEESRNTYS